MPLKMNPDQTASLLHLKNGLIQRMLLGSYPNQEGMEEHLLTGILHVFFRFEKQHKRAQMKTGTGKTALLAVVPILELGCVLCSMLYSKYSNAAFKFAPSLCQNKCLY